MDLRHGTIPKVGVSASLSGDSSALSRAGLRRSEGVSRRKRCRRGASARAPDEDRSDDDHTDAHEDRPVAHARRFEVPGRAEGRADPSERPRDGKREQRWTCPPMSSESCERHQRDRRDPSEQVEERARTHELALAITSSAGRATGTGAASAGSRGRSTGGSSSRRRPERRPTPPGIRDAIPGRQPTPAPRSIVLPWNAEVESERGTGRVTRERAAVRPPSPLDPGHAVSVTGMFTTLIFEPSIALTSYTRIVPGWVASTS